MQKIYTILILALLNTGIQAQDFKFGKVSEAEVLEKAHPLEKEANAAVLYRSVNTYYDYDPSQGFTLVTDVHERIKIYKKEGFTWATRELNHYKSGREREDISGLKGTTYNVVDGKLKEEKLKKDGIFEEDKTKYQISTKFTMPAVTEGSVVEYQYSLRSPFITVIDDVLLQYTIPINKMEVTVTIPEFFGFRKHSNPRSSLSLVIKEGNKAFNHTSTSVTKNVSTGFDIVKQSSQQKKVEYDQKTYSIYKEDIPSLREESHVDHLGNYAAFIKWELQYTKYPNSTLENLAATWEGVTKSIYTDGGYEKELSRTNFFENDLKQILEGITTPGEKAAKIYDFVRSKVKWNSYLGYMAENGTNKAYKEGVGNVGDINLLLTAMLKYAGVNAHPVLSSTRNNGVPLFPTRQGFNYVITAVELPNNEVILLDATDPNASFGELPERARNWTGRIVKNKDISDWVDLMPKEQSKTRSTLNLEIGSEGLKGKSIKLLSGLDAKSFRDNFRDVNRESYLPHLEKNKGNIRITELEIENELEPGKDIKESYNFELKNAIEVINNKVYLKPMLFMAQKENPFKADQRTHPIVFNYPSLHNSTINILVPEGYEVESLPESSIAELNTDAGIFKYVVLQNGNFIRVQSILDFKQIVYTPDDYEALKNFYAEIVEKHSETIVFKKI